VLIALLILALGGDLGAAQAPSVLAMSDGDIDRVEHWVEAVADHQPGAPDSAVTTVQGWSSDDLRMLWINANVLLSLMSELQAKSQSWSVSIPGLTKSSKTRTFTVQSENQKKPTEIRYNQLQLRRMEVFACAAVGDDLCMDLRVLSRDARQLAQMPPAQRRKERPKALLPLYDAAATVHDSGDDNFLLHHGAMLHADIATGDPPALAPSKKPGLPAPQQMHLQLFDGRETDRGEVAIHWVIGRFLLDAVTVVDDKKPVQAPNRDPIVRDWYHATAAWMQQRQNFDTVHVHHAVDLFQDDADILFLAGCLHETLASSSMSAAAAVAVAPVGFTFDIASARTELSRAETFFKRAVQARPAMLEARLHLGQVLLAQRQFDAAAQQLRSGAPDDEVLQYYHALFLGSAEEELGRYDAASAAYTRAAALQDIAQAPRLALIHLAWRRGNRSDAVRALQQLSDLPDDDSVERDPWWTYYTSSARNADQLLDGLRRRVGGGAR
jgi:hypothetical protein